MPHLNHTETASTNHHTVRINAESPAHASRASSIASEKIRNLNSNIPPADSNPKIPNSGRRMAWLFKRPWKLPPSLQWIPANFTWEHFKPVIRCAASGWIAIVLFVIPAVGNLMGQVSFSLSLCVCDSFF